MTVNNLTEEEILDYLMTSDFNEGLTPDELRFLLFKFRKFYRTIATGLANHKDRMDETIKISKISVENMEQKVQEIKKEQEIVENKYHLLLNKRLTWKERLSGKINNTQ